MTMAWVFSRFGLNSFWLTYPVTDTITSVVGFVLFRKFFAKPYSSEAKAEVAPAVMKPSHPGVIITIAREHGSGGKQVGRRLAEQLNIPFCYKEMTALAAQESGLDREFLSDINKNAPDRLHDLYLSTHVIQRIAENGSCVIVGRAADHVLRDHADVVRTFLYAPEEYRIQKVMAVYGDSREEAEKNIRRSDNARGAYYRSISGHEWGDPRQYDLLVDTSIGAEHTAQIIEQYLKMQGKI